MTRFLIILLLLVSFSTSIFQWARVNQLSSTDIDSLYYKDSTFYAGGKILSIWAKTKDWLGILQVLYRNFFDYKYNNL